MATEPLVSVITPAYRAKTISSAAAPSLLGPGRPCRQAIVAADDDIDPLAVLARAGVRNMMAENELSPWVEVELARLLEEPPRAP
jgi:hypothetical protein